MTQIQGIYELKKEQQHIGEAITVGYERIAGLRADFQDMRATLSDNSQQATTRSKAFMKEVHENISEASDTSFMQLEEMGRVNAEVMRKLHSISDRLEAVPSMANEQLSTMQSLVETLNRMQLKMHAGHQDPQTSTISKLELGSNNMSNESEVTDNSEAGSIMARISYYACTVTTETHSKDAQSIIEDIGRLLGFVTQELRASSPSRDDLPRKRKTLCNHDYSEVETVVQAMEDLVKAKRILTASQSVRIRNQGQ